MRGRLILEATCVRSSRVDTKGRVVKSSEVVDIWSASFDSSSCFNLNPKPCYTLYNRYILI